MAAFNRRRLLVYALYNYQRDLRRIQKSSSVSLFMESRRIFLIQQYLNHLKNLAMVDHFIRKKTRRKPRSCCRFVKNQGWWETIRDTHNNNKFYETFRLSRTSFYYISNKVSDEIEKKVVTKLPIPPDFTLAVTIYKLSRCLYISAGHYGTNFMFVCRDLLEAIFWLKCDSGMILMKKIHGGNFLENGRGHHVTIKNARSAKKIF